MNTLIIWLALSEFAMLLAFLSASASGYAFESQVRRQTNPPRTYLTFLGNATNSLAVFLANPLAAFLIGWHAHSWPTLGVRIVGVIVFVVGVAMIIPLLVDSKTTPSANFRNGKLTFTGVIYQLLVWPYQVTVFAAFYIFTPAAEITKTEFVVVTLLLVAIWGVSTLQPPLKVHGKTNPMAWAGAIAGWVVIAIAVVYQLAYFRFG